MNTRTPNISIAWKLSLYIIGITTLLAAIGLAFNYYIHYKAEIRRVMTSRQEIESSQAPLLTSALWDFDFNNIRLQLKGMFTIRHINYVALESGEEQNRIAYGERQEGDDFFYTIPLIQDKVGPIGNLEIQYSPSSVHASVRHELFVITLAVVLQMLLMAVLIIWIFKVKITRHLVTLGRYAKELSMENLDEAFAFQRKSNARFTDELDYLMASMDQMRKNMRHQLELKSRMEKHLQKAQKMEAIGTLAGGIAHDFNNILGAIIGYSELTAMDLDEGSRPRQHLHQVLQAGNRAKDLVNQILTFSRQTERQRTPTYIGPIIKEALKLLRASIPTTIEIKQDIAPEREAVVVDPTQIYQVLMNLCTNAAHAMAESGGTLEVRLYHETVDRKAADHDHELQEGPYLVLSVRDSGHGIGPEVSNRIFEPYYTTKESGEGTGLGLAVVHGIVTAHGGTIKVESRLNEGAAFHIYLPAVTTRDVAESPEPASPREGKEQILFIDDEPAIAELGKALLNNLGYTATAYTDAMAALAHFRTNPGQYQVVITDLTMPKITGDQLAKELKAVRDDIPIILCTGFSFQENPGHGMEAHGVNRLLKKPFTMADLSDAVRMVLDDVEKQKT